MNETERQEMARMRATRTGQYVPLGPLTHYPPPQETILQEAQRLVHGDRGADYGHPIDDYKATGEMWGAILERAKWVKGPVDPRIACLMMAAMKVSREAGKHKRDNLTDLAGYAECAQMVAERQEGK
ncbi:MAG TPA: DUF6378 domain-containing protein [Gemmatimonadales bacterium]|nr:DUF6378 domain-containing protein [Gemmatimonadales bacterium]